MADVKTMVFDIIARDNASKAFDKVSKATDTSGSKMSHWRVAAGAALAGAATAALEFGKKSVEAYSDAAKESMMLARTTGMTVTESSRLRFAAEESGVAFSTLSTSTRLFSKNLAAAGGDSKKTAAMVALLGFNFKDATGKLLPMSTLLPKVADRFKKMPDGPQKTALAMKLFGRSGADMIKILNKGSDGLRELGAQSDKTGNTIANTDAIQKQIQAQREFHAAISGLEIQLGSVLMPILTSASEFLAQHVAPAFSDVSRFVERNHAAFSVLVPVIGALVAVMGASLVVQKAWSVTQAALLPITKLLTSSTKEQAVATAELDGAMDANPIGLVVLAIAALAAGLIYAYKHSATFRAIVQEAFHAVGAAASAMWNGVIKPVFRFLVNTWLSVAGAIVNGAAHAFGWVPGIGPKLKAAASWFNDFRTRVNGELNGIHDKTVHVTAKVSGTSAVQGLINSISAVPRNTDAYVTTHVTGGVGSLLGAHHAGGGAVQQGMAYPVGETGPEYFVPSTNGRIVPGGGHSAAEAPVIINLNVTVAEGTDPLAFAKKAQKELLVLKRTLGGKSLGIA